MSLRSHTPSFKESAVLELAIELYGLRVHATPLPSERDQNFLLHTEAGERFVFKIANAQEERSQLEAQQHVLAHLAQHTALCPRVVMTRSGKALSAIQPPSGATHLVRLVTYLAGTPLGRLVTEDEIARLAVRLCGTAPARAFRSCWRWNSSRCKPSRRAEGAGSRGARCRPRRG